MGVGDTGFLIYPICPICQTLEVAGNWADESFRMWTGELSLSGVSGFLGFLTGEGWFYGTLNVWGAGKF